MGKQKKVSDKLRLFFRGCVSKPTRVADQNDMEILDEALRECIPKRSKVYFRADRGDQLLHLRIVIGLKAGLRALKHKSTVAMIYDDTASKHLTKFLIDAGRKLDIPVIQAHRLLHLQSIAELKTTALVINLVDESKLSENVVYKEKDPRPVSGKQPVDCEAFTRMFRLLQQYHNEDGHDNKQAKSGGRKRGVEFKLPELSQEAASDKNKAKKEAKTKKKSESRKANAKQKVESAQKAC